MYKLFKGLQQVMFIETCFMFTNFFNCRSSILRQTLCNAESVSKQLCFISLLYWYSVQC